MRERLSPNIVRDNLRNIIEQHPHEDYASASTLLGKNAAYIQQYIKRGIPKVLKESDRQILAKHFGVSEWILGGPTPDSNSYHPIGLSEDQSGMFLHIPFYDAQASAGPGSFVDEDSIDHMIPFEINWLRQIGVTDTSHLSMIEVTGDSMLPTLADGDQILVDLHQIIPGREAIYVFRWQDNLQVKRLRPDIGTGKIDIVSDNKLYDSFSNLPPSDLNIIGRVVWAGKKL